MNDFHYPQEWINNDWGGLFTVRYPWQDELFSVMRTVRPAGLVLPRIAGTPKDWAWWIRDNFQYPGPGVEYLRPGGIVEVICDYFDLEAPQSIKAGSPIWAETLLADYRKRVIDVQTRLVVVHDVNDLTWTMLSDVLNAQERTGIRMLCPIVIAHSAPRNNRFHVVRFGTPQVMGNLQDISFFPSQDPARWTRLYLALVILWECGAVPSLADELWTLLNGEMGLLTEPCFDEVLESKLDEFSRTLDYPRLQRMPEKSVCACVRPAPDPFGQLNADQEALWHEGVVSWYGLRFDITPLASRSMISRLSNVDDAVALR